MCCFGPKKTECFNKIQWMLWKNIGSLWVYALPDTEFEFLLFYTLNKIHFWKKMVKNMGWNILKSFICNERHMIVDAWWFVTLYGIDMQWRTWQLKERL